MQYMQEYNVLVLCFSISYLNLFTPQSYQVQNLTKILTNPYCVYQHESNVQWLSFEWSHVFGLSTLSKVRTRQSNTLSHYIKHLEISTSFFVQDCILIHLQVVLNAYSNILGVFLTITSMLLQNTNDLCKSSDSQTDTGIVG